MFFIENMELRLYREILLLIWKEVR